MVGGVRFRSPQKRRHRLSAGHRHSGGGASFREDTCSPQSSGTGLVRRRAERRAGCLDGSRRTDTDRTDGRSPERALGRAGGVGGGTPGRVIARPPHGDRRSDAQCGDHVVGHINVASPYRTPEINLIPYASCKLNVKEKRPPSSKCLVFSKGEMAGHWPRCPSCETRPQREARRGGDVTQPAVGPWRSSELAGLTPWLLRGFAGTPWCCRSPRVVFSGGCAS